MVMRVAGNLFLFAAQQQARIHRRRKQKKKNIIHALTKVLYNCHSIPFAATFVIFPDWNSPNHLIYSDFSTHHRILLTNRYWYISVIAQHPNVRFIIDIITVTFSSLIFNLCSYCYCWWWWWWRHFSCWKSTWYSQSHHLLHHILSSHFDSFIQL